MAGNLYQSKAYGILDKKLPFSNRNYKSLNCDKTLYLLDSDHDDYSTDKSLIYTACGKQCNDACWKNQLIHEVSKIIDSKDTDFQSEINCYLASDSEKELISKLIQSYKKREERSITRKNLLNQMDMYNDSIVKFKLEKAIYSKDEKKVAKFKGLIEANQKSSKNVCQMIKEIENEIAKNDISIQEHIFNLFNKSEDDSMSAQSSNQNAKLFNDSTSSHDE